jgi:hypothetical protein
VLFFLEVIGKVYVAGHLAFLLMCWYLPVSVLVLIQAVRHDGALPMPTSTSSYMEQGGDFWCKINYRCEVGPATLIFQLSPDPVQATQV